ncbi:methyltransferase domain-containing protein [Microbacterium sp. 18062]|uniref:methyltransferase domain-containing protein n=1 Tax=Microbacterium sp. 18062 TaxID=2681410 RepID=UPI0013572CB6|nr:methyltransferase domain-containing protein [Microbacterium sp. 18062]
MMLGTRDRQVRELMDDPDCDPARLAATLHRFDTVNRLISGWGRVYRRVVRPFLRSLGRPARVLDLGCGGGDVIARLARLAADDGLRAEWLGVDPDPRALPVARRRSGAGLGFRCVDSTALRGEGERFDLVLSNHVLHHLSDDELLRFAEDSLALSSGLVLHADIARSRTAYALYAVGITPLAPGTFLRTDGLRSIRRSYRADELADALSPAGAWTVRRPAPFRLLAVGRGRA